MAEIEKCTRLYDVDVSIEVTADEWCGVADSSECAEMATLLSAEHLLYGLDACPLSVIANFLTRDKAQRLLSAIQSAYPDLAPATTLAPETAEALRRAAFLIECMAHVQNRGESLFPISETLRAAAGPAPELTASPM